MVAGHVKSKNSRETKQYQLKPHFLWLLSQHIRSSTTGTVHTQSHLNHPNHQQIDVIITLQTRPSHLQLQITQVYTILL